MMIPNKKTVNAKNQSPWILCPSKRIPGKFYYFNHATGEAAWSLSDSDKNYRKGTIRQITDKSHTFPEPSGPPNDESTTSNSFTSPKNAGSADFTSNVKIAPPYHAPPPAFGQAVFPKYGIPEVMPSKIVWTLTPMIIPDQPTQTRQTCDQITQTVETQSLNMQPYSQFQPNGNYPNAFQFSRNSTPHKQFEKEMPIFGHGKGMPTFGRRKETPMFGHGKEMSMFGREKEMPTFRRRKETPMFGHKNETQIFGHGKEIPMFGHEKQMPMFGQTSFNAFKSKEAQTFSGKPTFAPRHRTRSETESTPKSVLKPSRSVENIASLFKNDFETFTLSPQHKVDNSKAKLDELDENDLRFLLVAKKKKGELREISKSMEDLSKPHQASMAPRKRVTFDLHEDTSSEDTPEIDQSPQYFSEAPEQPAPSSGHQWYVVADIDALMADYLCIEQYVQRDSRCRLLIPNVVRAQLAARGRGDGGAVSARHLLRKLMSPPDYIVVQNDTEYEYPSPEENILRCCWDLLQENCRVILVTNNKEMLTEAERIDLKCYTLDEIKNGYRPLPLPQVDFSNVKIVVNNENKKSENLFMQFASDIKKNSSTKINGFQVNRPKFNKATVVDNVFCKNNNNSDKLIDLTRSKSEISNVKEQINKLSITENTNMQNRTKLIMKNAFQNTETDKNNRNVVLLHENSKLNVKINTESRNEDVESVIDLDEIDHDIGTLNFAERNAEKTRDTIKVSGITKLNNQFNLDEELAKFYIKNATMEKRIEGRLDEWICRLCQIMEGALTDVLLKEKVDDKPVTPTHKYRYLYEPIQAISKTYKEEKIIKMIADRLSLKLVQLSTDQGDLIKDMKPNDFLKIFGFCKILLEKMKDIIDYDDLYEAEDMLDDLIRNIEDPSTDIDVALQPVNTPILSRSEIVEPKVEVAFRKSEKEIVDYLKKHFESWNTVTVNETNVNKPKVNETNVNKPKVNETNVNKPKVNETNVNKPKVNETNVNKPNIVRTCGKNLNMLKISSTKAISVNNKHNEDPAKENEPKIIRNIKIIEAFEEKFKNKDKLDLEELNYDDTSSDYNDSNKTEENKSVDNLKTQGLTECQSVLDDLSVSTSSTDTECVHAYPLTKLFLVRLKGTLLLVFNFINEAVTQCQEGMPNNKKEDYRLKFETTHQYVLKLIERLKNIIARESGDGVTLKDLLIKAGDYVDDDEIIVNYKEIITKFLEQANILEDALAIMLSLFNGSPKGTGYCTNVSTFNSSSPILPTRCLRSNKL